MQRHCLLEYIINKYISSVHQAEAQKGPGTVKNQIALERAAHEYPPTGTSEPNDKILLVEVLVLVVILRRHLHEVASGAGVEVVVHCSGRSGKAIKTER